MEHPIKRLLLLLEILVRVVPKCRMFEKKLKMEGTIWALLLSLLALRTSFQENNHNNQLVVTPTTERPAAIFICFFPS